MEFVQVDLRTNLDSSLALGDRSRAADGVIRLLRGENAGYSLLYSCGKLYHIGDGTTFTGFPAPFIRHIDDPFAVSGNPTIDHSKPPRSRRNERPTPTNEKRTIKAQHPG